MMLGSGDVNWEMASASGTNTQGVAPSGTTPWSRSKNDLANESQVVVAAGGIRDGRAAVNFDRQSGLVEDVPAIDIRIIAVGISDGNRAADVAAAVDVTSGYRAAVARSRGHAAVSGTRDVSALILREGDRLRTENRSNGPRKNTLPVLHPPLPSPGQSFPKGRNVWRKWLAD